MANYYATSRTNYFTVTDEKRYQQLFKGLSAEGGLEDFSKADQNGVLHHGFGAYSTVEWFDPEKEEYEDPSFDYFISELQKILSDNSAFIYMEVGNEKLRYLIGYALIATKDEIKCIDLSDAEKLAKEMLHDASYEAKCYY